MLRSLVSKVVGDPNAREIARLQQVVERINALEPQYESLSDEGLRALTDQFRERLAAGERLDDLLVEAFAAVREAAKRTIGLRHFDVQLIGGIVLHQGKIAEMKTGEGKTLVATLPLYLNALTGCGVHLVTPNDYLSKVGVQWMGPIYHLLGLGVGVIQSAAADPQRGSFLYDPDYPSEDDRFLNLRPAPRQEVYEADITYGTNNEFGFDYLRDNMVRDLGDCVQRELHYAIVDEVDNILIDEARTPLIISGPAEESSELYRRFADIVRRLRPSSPGSVQMGAPDGDYVVEEKTQVVTLTEAGVDRVEGMLPEIGPGASLYQLQYAHMLPYLDNALRAHVIHKRDRDYIVKDGQVIIVDEFTGRLMYGRRYSEGLHQAIEAKEGVAVRRESLTHATITFQNYFRMYEKLAGMTGTAATEAEEFQKIYGLDVVVLPTNVEYRAIYGDLTTCHRFISEIDEVTFAGVLDGRGDVEVTTYESPDGAGRRFFKRLDFEDSIYKNKRAKFLAVVDEIEALYRAGRPVLVGTIAIETSEMLSGMLRRRGIPHQVLNAKYHEQEAVIIAQAGRSGAVTIATNMAGRGVDIKLGGDSEGVARERLRREGSDLTEIPQAGWNRALEMLRQGKDPREVYTVRWAEVLTEAVADCAEDQRKVLALGGLHVLGTERHEARRIDNQLRGRCARQGDPGSSRFYISLEDDLMRRFGGERVQALMDRTGMQEDIPLEFGILSKSIESAQTRVEGYNFDIRKHVLEYDDVVNKQREVIYAQRRKVLSQPGLRDQVLRMVREELSRLVAAYTPGPDSQDWDLRALYNELRTFFPLPPDANPTRWARLTRDQIEAQLHELAERGYDDLNHILSQQAFAQVSRENVTLQGLAESSDPLRQLAYERIVERLGAELSADLLKSPIRKLPSEVKERVEAGFADGLRLYRDRQLMLNAVDRLWIRHLTDLDGLREGIGLRAYGQQDPLIAYRKEAHDMYQALLGGIQEGIVRSVYLVPAAAVPRKQQRLQAARPRMTGGERLSESGRARPALSRVEGPALSRVEGPRRSLGRNDLCWCGSGKKYKNCHLRQDQEEQQGPVAAAPPPRTPGRRRRRRR